MSEIMVRALERIDRFRWKAGGFDAWLFGILRNVVLEGYRRDAMARRDGTFRPDIPASDEPLDTIIDNEKAAHLRYAFAGLTDDEQEILELRVVAGLSAEDLARVIGKRAGTVRMAQNRALSRLRANLKEVDDER